MYRNNIGMSKDWVCYQEEPHSYAFLQVTRGYEWLASYQGGHQQEAIDSAGPPGDPEQASHLRNKCPAH